MIRDLNGDPIPYGKTKRTIEETFIFGNTLPSWLTVTGTGDYQIVPPSEDYGYFQLRTGAALNNTVALNILPSGINMSKVKEIILELDSLTFDANNNGFYLTFLNSDKQNGLQVFNSFDQIQGRKANVGKNISSKYWFNVGERRNVTLRIRDDRTVILTENDSVTFEHQFAETEMGVNYVLFPVLSLKNLDAAGIKSIKFSRIALSLIHN